MERSGKKKKERKELGSGCVAVIERYPVTIASHEERGEGIRVLKGEMSGADTNE